MAFTCMSHGCNSQGAPNPLAPAVRADSDIGDQVNFILLIPVRDQADVADDFTILLPDVAGKRHGDTLNRIGSPAHEGIILTGAAHLLEVTAAFRVDCVGKTFFDQVSHSWQVSQDVQRAQLWHPGENWSGDGGHPAYYSGYTVLCINS